MRTWEVGESKGWEDLDKHEEEEIKKKKGFNGEVRKRKKETLPGAEEFLREKRSGLSK